MPFGYPVFLELGGHTCVVIGETAVRERKVEGLLAGGASLVRVVAEGPSSRLEEIERENGQRVRVARRAWQPEDLDGALLCVASSADAVTRSAIAREARRRRVLVNVMDDIENCDWAAPSIVRRGDLVLAISTGGASPALARMIRIELEDRFGTEWSDVLGVLKEIRQETLSQLPDLRERSRLWSEALDLEEATELAREGRLAELRDRLRSRLTLGVGS